MHIPPLPFHRGPTYLFLCECKIDRGTLDSIAENLPNLRKIDLHTSEHAEYSRGTFAKLISAKRLNCLFLMDAKLDSADLDAIASSKLKTLTLWQCTLPDQSFSFLAKSRIESFEYVPSYEQGDCSLTVLKDCVNLRNLNVSVHARDNRCLEELVELKNAGAPKEITIRMPFNYNTQRQIKKLKLDEPKEGIKITISKG